MIEKIKRRIHSLLRSRRFYLFSKKISRWARCLKIKWQLYVHSVELRDHEIRNLNRYEIKIYSQNGEDGILDAIFSKIGTTNKFYVEFGVEDGEECNTRFLQNEKGWRGLLMDGYEQKSKKIKKEFITAENINDLFRKYQVPKAFDLLSIDIDGNDYWVWKAIDSSYAPRVVVIEYNASIPPTESKVIPYDPNFSWDITNYFGASLLALVKLAKTKGYTLVGCDLCGVNAFFVQDRLMLGHFITDSIDKLYRPVNYFNKGMSHPSKEGFYLEV